MIAENDIFERLVELGTNERLDQIIQTDKDYLILQERNAQIQERYNALNLTEEQYKTIGEYLDSEHMETAFLVNRAYKQGVFDSVALLKKMKVL